MAKQSDFTGNIKKYGCLWFSLVNIAEEMCGCKLSHANVLHMYKHLQDRGYMDKQCFVKDHSAVINEALSYMICPEIRAVYTGAQYLDKLYKSWGASEGSYIILQVKTEFVPGHFLRFNYNPYYPPSKILGVRSVRYYEIK